MSGRYRRIVDLVELTAMLQREPTGLAIGQIAERFEVSRRTAERMLEALRERFPDLEPQLKEGRKYWRLPPSSVDQPLHLPDRLAALTRRVEELRAEVEQHAIAESALSASGVGVFVLDPKFRVVWMNRAMQTYFGLSAESAVGRDKRTLIQEHVRSIVDEPDEFERRAFATYEDNASIENFVCHVLPAEGREERWLEHWSQPITSGEYAGGRIEHYVDVTEWQLDELREARWHGDRDEPPRLEASSAAGILGGVASALEEPARARGVLLRTEIDEGARDFLADPARLVPALADLGRAMIDEAASGSALMLRANCIEALGSMSLSLSPAALDPSRHPGGEASPRYLVESAGSAFGAAGRQAVRHGGHLIEVRHTADRPPSVAMQLPFALA